MERGQAMRKTKRKNKLLIAVLIAISVCIAACGKKGEEDDPGTAGGILENGAKGLDMIAASGIPSPTPVPSPTPTMTPEPTPDLHEGKKQGMLNGEWIDEDVVEHRPYAVMLNNIKVASPQSGIGQADIVYEALTEAGITRFLALFSKIGKDTPAAARLGSVRSARHYFVSFADEYDAIFVHFGETTYAKKKMDKLKIDHITGMYGVGVSSFYRDKSIKAPHNAFASLEGIENAVKKGKFRTEYEEGYKSHFKFYAENTVPEIVTKSSEKTDGLPASGVRTPAAKITLGFSDYMKPYFLYDAKNEVYMRYQFDGEHVDYNTKEQLAFKNIIIQLVKEWNIDKNGYQTMDIEKAEGTGFYITNNTVQPVTWKKDEGKRFMRYYSEDGEELIINPGKTYIAVFPINREKHIAIE